MQPNSAYEAASRLWSELISTGKPGTGKWTSHCDVVEK